jgi:hypothetical protein
VDTPLSRPNSAGFDLRNAQECVLGVLIRRLPACGQDFRAQPRDGEPSLDLGGFAHSGAGCRLGRKAAVEILRRSRAAWVTHLVGRRLLLSISSVSAFSALIIGARGSGSGGVRLMRAQRAVARA